MERYHQEVISLRKQIEDCYISLGKDIIELQNRISQIEDNKKGEEPLTFEKIRAKCVAGESLLVDRRGDTRLYLGFNREGNLVTDRASGQDCLLVREWHIENWKISDEKWRGK